MNKDFTHVICLNGVTSSGKTSIADAIREISEHNYFNVSVDVFQKMANPKYLTYGNYFNELNDCISVMYDTIASLIRHKKSVILDTVFLDIPEYPSIYEKFTDVCTGSVFNIHVKCPVDECEKRNLKRSDRTKGQSVWQSERMLEIPYFLTVDTMNNNANECARKILEQIEQHTV